MAAGVEPTGVLMQRTQRYGGAGESGAQRSCDGEALGRAGFGRKIESSVQDTVSLVLLGGRPARTSGVSGNTLVALCSGQLSKGV